MTAMKSRHNSSHTRRTQRIQARTLHDVTSFFAASDDRLSTRIRELEHEWDIERALEANAAALALVGLALGLAADRRFFLVTFLSSACLLQQALSGWSPALPLLRRYGIRTSAEIQQEILALRILRGDFLEKPVYPESLLAAAAH
jgi:hypothetical protein